MDLIWFGLWKGMLWQSYEDFIGGMSKMFCYFEDFFFKPDKSFQNSVLKIRVKTQRLTLKTS